jgi:hypothetical protein
MSIICKVNFIIIIEVVGILIGIDKTLSTEHKIEYIILQINYEEHCYCSAVYVIRKICRKCTAMHKMSIN